MIQNSLIDYISSQLKLGISRDVVKASLLGAGWAAADVEETLKQVESGMPAGAAAVKPAATMPVTGTKTPADAQTIRVSDLISTSDSISTTAKPAASAAASAAKPATSFTAKSNPISAASPMSVSTAVSNSTSSPNLNLKNMSSASDSTSTPASALVSGSGKGKSGLIMEIVGGVVILGLGGFAGFLFMQNSALTAKIATLTAQSATVTANLTSLQENMNSTSTGLGAQVADLTAQNAELLTDLSFYAVPLSNPQTQATVTGMISGGGKVPFVVTTKYGAKITIQNSRDPKVAAWLIPLVGTTASVAGTYTPGTPLLTAIPPTPASAPATSAATSTPAATSTASTSTSTATTTVK